MDCVERIADMIASVWDFKALEAVVRGDQNLLAFFKYTLKRDTSISDFTQVLSHPFIELGKLYLKAERKLADLKDRIAIQCQSEEQQKTQNKACSQICISYQHLLQCTLNQYGRI